MCGASENPEEQEGRSRAEGGCNLLDCSPHENRHHQAWERSSKDSDRRARVASRDGRRVTATRSVHARRSGRGEKKASASAGGGGGGEPSRERCGFHFKRRTTDGWMEGDETTMNSRLAWVEDGVEEDLVHLKSLSVLRHPLNATTADVCGCAYLTWGRGRSVSALLRQLGLHFPVCRPPPFYSTH